MPTEENPLNVFRSPGTPQWTVSLKTFLELEPFHVSRNLFLRTSCFIASAPQELETIIGLRITL